MEVVQKNNDSKKIFTLLVIIFTLMICTTSATYAYLAFSASDSNTVVGTTASTSLELNVERKLPSTVGVMVPQLEEYLGSAISSTYNCIDDNGNTVCQVYKATVTNESTATVKVNGSIKFSGIENMPNLKWKRITNETTIGEYESNVASTSRSFFEKNKSFVKNESATYYFVIWIDEIESTQTDSGTFRVTIEFTPENGGGLTSTILPMNEYASSIMVPTAVSDKDIDFSQTSEASNTNGIYYIEETKNDQYPIYYYRGNVNNNLIFADTCWKVVRTTDTGGLKLIYNGLPSSGQCNNTGEATSIGNKAFNSSYNSPAYVGYMYGTPYTYSTKSMSSVTDTYYYGNDVSYSNGTYTLTGTTTSASWSSIYNGGLNNYHYTCLSTGYTCTSVYYIYYTTSSTAYYITLTGGKKIENALSEMLDYNTTSSTIKGNNTTEGTLDYWYYTNIYNQGYSSYIEDTVWCNDRSVGTLNGWNPDGGSTRSHLYFSTYNRVWTNASPSVSCSRDIDKFTVSDSNGNGALDYPVGLLTVDEIMLAGADNNYTENSSYYLYSGDYYWAGSPFLFNRSAVGTNVIDVGNLTYYNVDDSYDVRPSVSLKPGFTLTGDGDGTVTNPYQLSY